MSSAKVFARCCAICCATCFAILSGAGVFAADQPTYQKGTITLATGTGHKSYNLNAGAKIYQIGNCGDFQNGQEVNFFVKEYKIYIAHEGAKEYKCAIESTTESTNPNSQPTISDMTVVYLKGTILGYSIRRDVRVSGGGGTPGGSGFPVGSSTRKAKVYELQGPDLIYEVDYCGAFQAGQFAPGQAVEFRVDNGGGRLYIRHDGNKEYGCQLEGTRKPDAQPGEAMPSTAASTASPTPATAPATAKLSVASVPDGADIEIDGNFSGNTPSDLEVEPGEHSIVLKKSGYQNWERKMKVVTGSTIHLNAEMEKSSNP
ncbi:MAG TPA: PEGA domain-containing protein [Candidatus Solibacter sp.]|nr:PEGA domain-containing protein [Candidatus Solibacter sp.]